MNEIVKQSKIDIVPQSYVGLPEPISQQQLEQQQKIVAETVNYIKKRSIDKNGNIMPYEKGALLVKLPGIDKPFLTEKGVILVLQKHGLMVGPHESIETKMDDEITVDGQVTKGHLRYKTKVAILASTTGGLVMVAEGQANTKEAKHRIRGKARVCPTCGKIAVKKSKFKGGYYCYPKPFGGCTANFKDNDDRIISQDEVNAENDSPYDLYDIVQEMSVIRALRKGPKRLGYGGYFSDDDNDTFSGNDDFGIGEPQTKKKNNNKNSAQNGKSIETRQNELHARLINLIGSEDAATQWIEQKVNEKSEGKHSAASIFEFTSPMWLNWIEDEINILETA